jgi:hypothetical protein
MMWNEADKVSDCCPRPERRVVLRPAFSKVSMRYSILVMLALSTLACGSTTDASPSADLVGIAAGAGKYRPSEMVDLTIANLSSRSLEFSTCAPRLEREAPGGRWEAVHQDELPCPAVLELLDGYASRRAVIPLPAALAPGAYRVRFPWMGRWPGDEEPFLEATQLGGTFTVP